MTIVMAFDQHREQITFDALDTVTGELHRIANSGSASRSRSRR
jgi:hypothetical protein